MMRISITNVNNRRVTESTAFVHAAALVRASDAVEPMVPGVLLPRHLDASASSGLGARCARL